MSNARTLIRPSTDADVAAITRIYAHHVLHGTGSFELEPPGEADMAARRADVRAKGLPHLVIEHGEPGAQGGQVAGFAYANHFRPRLAYRYSLEDSIYLAPEAAGRGLGKLLLAELIARCEAFGARQMVAVIGDSGNAASIALHRALGFTDAGRLRASGWKFGRWIDTVLMQRPLGLGDRTGPMEGRPA